MTLEKRKLKVSEIVADILNGVTDSGLMERYGLSRKQLRRLLQKLVNRGHLSQDQLDARTTFEDTFVTKAYVDVNRSIRTLNDNEVLGIIAQAQQNASTGTLAVQSNNLADDIRSGVSDKQLLKKYELATIQLDHMLANLLDTGQVSRQDMANRLNLSDTAITKAFMEVHGSMEEFEDI